MPASVLQVNISRGGVPKNAVPEGEATPLGLVGDVCKHPEYHGGPRQALLIITSEAIEELNALGYSLYPGALGENLTTVGLDRRTLRAGQRYRIGRAIVELTKVRTPCATLNVYGPGIQKAMYDEQVKAKNPSSPRWALSGFYTAVIRPGTIRPGDPITLLEETT